MVEENYTAEEFLDWLCWCKATEGDRFYPPDKTADECMDAVRENYEERHTGRELEMELAKAREWERGQHSRAYTDAVDFFRDMKAWGFDPVERAAREHYDLMQRADGDVDPIDWTWLGDRDEFIGSLIRR